MKHRSRRSYRSQDEGSLLGLLIKYTFLLALVGAVGGATWLALAPLTPPVKEVVRPLPHDRLGPL